MIRLAALAGLLATAAAAQPIAPPEAARLAADTLDARRALPDDWIARDKALHLTASMLGTLSAQYVLVDKAELSNGDALPLAAGSALAMGLLKEVVDARRERHPHFCWRDLAVDALGVALAAGVIAL